MSRVIVLWSGGKDAMQALCHAREAGHQVVALALMFWASLFFFIWSCRPRFAIPATGSW